MALPPFKEDCPATGPMYDMWTRTEDLRVIARAFKEYKAAGKTMEDFEEDYDCSIIFDNVGYGITKTGSGVTGIEFQNDSCKTAFMLKYKL